MTDIFVNIVHWHILIKLSLFWFFDFFLKYGLCKKSLRKNETLACWTLLAHFFSCWSGKKVSQKCSTGENFIFSQWQNPYFSNVVDIISPIPPQGLNWMKVQNIGKIFSLVPSKKPVYRENWEKLLFSQKLKNIHLVCLRFLWWQVFLREREKIFYTSSGYKCQNLGGAPPPGTDSHDVCALALGFIIACLRSAYFTHYPRLRSLVIVLHCSQDCIFCGPKERKKRSRK